MKHTKYFPILTISIFLTAILASCIGENSNTQNNSKSNTPPETPKNKCYCNRPDMESLANKFMSNFTEIQNTLDSDQARIISLESITDNGNCTWQVIFKISWPFGNTDGAHPDEYISKTGFCNSQQIYLQ